MLAHHDIQEPIDIGGLGQSIWYNPEWPPPATAWAWRPIIQHRIWAKDGAEQGRSSERGNYGDSQSQVLARLKNMSRSMALRNSRERRMAMPLQPQ